ncbi:MAG: AMP-binding protein [Acidimicrobiia bacterium]
MTSSTVASLLRARATDDHPGYVFEDRTWSWADVVDQSAARAAALTALRRDGPFHVGVLLDNVPEYLFLAGGAALVGAVIVGINPTRRGEELARDIRHTDCQIVITDAAQAALLDRLDLGAATGRVLLVDSPEWRELIADSAAHARLPDADPPGDRALFLLFTSGSTSAPKAVVCSSERMAMAGARAALGYGVTRDDVCYCAMPLFHGNALMACWAPALSQGATVVLRRRFSATSWLDDIRRHGCTYFTYVGRTIAYVLAQPATPHDQDHRLRLGFGTEASALDRARFEARFGAPLVEGYGSSESVVVIMRTPDTPEHALGRARTDNGADVAVIDPDSCDECPPARFDEHGALINGSVAIGELVNRAGGGLFEGYYNNREATEDRLRNGWYWTGDLAYRDADGFFYFAGRSADWLRVDSENFAAAPVERILHRFPGAVMVAVYAVPDPRTGDQVMAAVEMAPEVPFDPGAFDDFLVAQRDLGTKWAPAFVRVVSSMPLTANNKVHKPPLRAEGWACDDAVWWRPDRGERLRRMTADDRSALSGRFAQHGRRYLLSTGDR